MLQPLAVLMLIAGLHETPERDPFSPPGCHGSLQGVPLELLDVVDTEGSGRNARARVRCLDGQIFTIRRGDALGYGTVDRIEHNRVVIRVVPLCAGFAVPMKDIHKPYFQTLGEAVTTPDDRHPVFRP